MTADYNAVRPPPMVPRGPLPSSTTYAYAKDTANTYQAPYSTYTATLRRAAILQLRRLDILRLRHLSILQLRLQSIL